MDRKNKFRKKLRDIKKRNKNLLEEKNAIEK